MKMTIQVVIERDDQPPMVDEIACLERATLTPDTLGLTLAEAKTVLAQLQEVVVTEQVAAYVAQQQTCPHCSAPRTRKGHHQIVSAHASASSRCPALGSTPAPARLTTRDEAVAPGRPAPRAHHP